MNLSYNGGNQFLRDEQVNGRMRPASRRRTRRMSDESTLLLDDERVLGRYTAVILRQSSAGTWQLEMMQLNATVTIYRLLLRPLRKKYAPATIPAHYFRALTLTERDGHRCVQMTLITGHVLHMKTATGSTDEFFNYLLALKLPRPRVHFDDQVARRDIERLVQFFEGPALVNL